MNIINTNCVHSRDGIPLERRDCMEKEDFINDLYWKWFLTEMKTRLVGMICCLMEDQDYTREELLIFLMEIVDSIEMEERMVNTGNIREKLLVGSERNKV